MSTLDTMIEAVLSYLAYPTSSANPTAFAQFGPEVIGVLNGSGEKAVCDAFYLDTTWFPRNPKIWGRDRESEPVRLLRVEHHIKIIPGRGFFTIPRSFEMMLPLVRGTLAPQGALDFFPAPKPLGITMPAREGRRLSDNDIRRVAAALEAQTPPPTTKPT